MEIKKKIATVEEQKNGKQSLFAVFFSKIPNNVLTSTSKMSFKNANLNIELAE